MEFRGGGIPLYKDGVPASRESRLPFSWSIFYNYKYSICEIYLT